MSTEPGFMATLAPTALSHLEEADLRFSGQRLATGQTASALAVMAGVESADYSQAAIALICSLILCGEKDFSSWHWLLQQSPELYLKTRVLIANLKSGKGSKYHSDSLSPPSEASRHLCQCLTNPISPIAIASASQQLLAALARFATEREWDYVACILDGEPFIAGTNLVQLMSSWSTELMWRQYLRVDEDKNE